MKFNLNKKKSIGTLRTLKILKVTLLNLLTKKSFEDIQIQEICNKSMIPRSTFYNYFEDKYDFLNWFLSDTSEKEYPELKEVSDLDKIFNTFFDVIDSYKDIIDKVLNKNPRNSYFYHAFINNIENASIEMLTSYSKNISSNSSFPTDLKGKWYAHAVILVFEWVYVEHNNCSREDILNYINIIINRKS